MASIGSALPTDTSSDPALADALAREQYRVLGRQVPTMYALLLINSAFLAIFGSTGVPAMVAYILPITIAIAAVLRMVIWFRRLKSHRPETTADIIGKLNGTARLAAALAIILGGWSMAILWLADATGQSLVPFFTVMSTITCGYCLLALPKAANRIIFLGTVPISLALIMTGTMHLQAAGFNLLLVAGLVQQMVATQYRQFLRILTSSAEVQTEKAKAYRLAHIDDLTGLPNRRAFLAALTGDDAAHGDITAAACANPGVAVIMLDLDGFKPINDTHGHATGDGLLVGAALRLAAVTPGPGLVARLGGDEFAILLRDLRDANHALATAQAIRATFRDPFLIGNQQFRVGASFGVAFFAAGTRPPLQPPSPRQDVGHGGGIALLHQADLALYDAKRRKSADPVLFSSPMDSSVRRRMSIEQALADPVQRAQIRLVFQPIVAADSLVVTGYEALARWDHPVIGAISPAEFVGIAEQSGSIDALTEQLFAAALVVARDWPETITLSFNLGAAELNAHGLAGKMAALMQAHGFDPRRLAIEVTETALLNDFALARQSLDLFRAAGSQVWLDDFGAGYSSLGYLREMAFDAIKLDGDLIRTVVENQATRALLIGVIQLCQAIDTPVIAEMVETKDQLALLRALPIARYQGYYFARPMTGEATRLDTAQLQGFQRG